MNAKNKKPEWAPKDSGDEFASNVVDGVSGGHDGMPGHSTQNHAARQNIQKRKKLTAADYVRGVLQRDRTLLGRTITLLESNSPIHFELGQAVLKELLPKSGNSIRIGISGMPGAGKSTLIEELGLYLLEKGHRVAVLAVDPSSSVTGGSILGDKTRMEKLARDENSFIRPSPSGGALGGVARKTREIMAICEAAGYDVILVETVGVGQSEITVRSMVDFFLLVQLPGGGDELQGIKKGVMEIADALAVNKADGDNKIRAEASRQDYAMALHYMAPATPGWVTNAFCCSAITGEGVPELWQTVQKFAALTKKSGVWADRRKQQAREWMYALVNEYLQGLFKKHPAIQKILPDMERKVVAGEIPVATAALEMMHIFEKQLNAG